MNLRDFLEYLKNALSIRVDVRKPYGNRHHEVVVTLLCNGFAYLPFEEK